jgi:hypothetical protein
MQGTLKRYSLVRLRNSHNTAAVIPYKPASSYFPRKMYIVMLRVVKSIQHLGYGLDGRYSVPGKKKFSFYSHLLADGVLTLQNPSTGQCRMLTGGKADHSLSPHAKVKNALRCTSASPRPFSRRCPKVQGYLFWSIFTDRDRPLVHDKLRIKAEQWEIVFIYSLIFSSEYRNMV